MMLVAAAPAMAHPVAIAGDVDNSDDTLFLNVDASQTQTADATQFGGDAFALGDGSAASVNNDLSIDQTQVNGGLGFIDFDVDDDGILDEFDHVILFGDFNNNGIVDDLEFMFFVF